MKTLIVGARSSPLSQAQVREVQAALHDVQLSPLFVETTGDRDQKTSLRSLGKTDFFTCEVDELLLSGKCDIAIHSAKDLPEPLPQGIQLVALTKGVDASDALVMRAGTTLSQLPHRARIGTSSERREEAVRMLRNDLTFVDIRGTIAQRLAKLENGEVDGVVIAEAALIRLQLKHLNRIKLPGETTPLQGQLAIMAREGDEAMKQVFAPLDVRKHILYLGLEVPLHLYLDKIYHYPVIRIIPRQAVVDLEKYTHILLTSKTAVRLLPILLKDKIYIVVGKSTASVLREQGIEAHLIASEESSEGIIKELDKISLQNAHLFWPHSALSRPLINHYLTSKGVSFEECVLYDTLCQRLHPVPDLNDFDEILFTSPSTVQGFLEIYGSLPTDKKLTAIGNVTADAIKKSSVQKPTGTGPKSLEKWL